MFPSNKIPRKLWTAGSLPWSHLRELTAVLQALSLVERGLTAPPLELAIFDQHLAFRK